MAVDEKWYFTKEQLLQSPSRKSGYDVDKELSCRQQAANFIQDMGQRLQVSQLCINTAIVYMHRFYVFHSFAAFHRNGIAAAALFLAAKVEEQPRKLEHVIKVSHMCLHRENPNLDTKSELYLEQAQDLVFNENVLLQTLGFDVAIDHPHTYVVRCCHLVRASKDLAQTSYFMASNSLHLTTMCLQYKPTVVACFCIHLACKWSNWEIPRSNEGKDWFWYIDKTVTIDLLEQLTAEFIAVLDKCPTKLKRKMMSMNQNQTPGFTQQQQHGPHEGLQFEEPRKLPSGEGMKPPEGLFPVQKSGSQASSDKPGTSNPATVPTLHAHHQKIDYREYREKKERERMEREKQQQLQQRDTHNVSSGNHHHHSKSNAMPNKPHGIMQSRSSGSSVSHKSYQQPPHGVQQNMHFQNVKESRDSISAKDSNYLKQHPPHIERDVNKDNITFHGQYSQNSNAHQNFPHKSESNYSGNYLHREGSRGSHSVQGSGNSNVSQTHNSQNQNAIGNSSNSNQMEYLMTNQRDAVSSKDSESQSQSQGKDAMSSSIRDIINQSVSQRDIHSMTSDRKEHVRDKSRINFVHGSTSSNFKHESMKSGRDQMVNFHDPADRKMDDFVSKSKEKPTKKEVEESVIDTLKMEPIHVKNEKFDETDIGDENNSTWNSSTVRNEKLTTPVIIKTEPNSNKNESSIDPNKLDFYTSNSDSSLSGKLQSGHPMKMFDSKYKSHHYHSTSKSSENPQIKIEKPSAQCSSDLFKKMNERNLDKTRKIQDHERLPLTTEGSSNLGDISKHHKFNKEINDKNQMIVTGQHNDQRLKEKLSPSKSQRIKTVPRPPGLNYLKSDSGHFSLDANPIGNVDSEKIEVTNHSLTSNRPSLGLDDSNKSSGNLSSFPKQKNHEFGAPGNLSNTLQDSNIMKTNKTSSIFSPDSKIPPQNILSSLEKESKKSSSVSHRSNHSSSRTSPNSTTANSKKTVSGSVGGTLTPSTTSSTGSLFSPPLQKNISSVPPRQRTSSSGSEPELMLIVKKLEETPGYENIIREKKIALTPTNEVMGNSEKEKEKEKEKKMMVGSDKVKGSNQLLFGFDMKTSAKDSKSSDSKSNLVKSDVIAPQNTSKTMVNVKFPNEIRSDLGAVIYPTNPKSAPSSKSSQGFSMSDTKHSFNNSISTVNLLGVEKMVDTSISPAKQTNQFNAVTVKPSACSNINFNSIGSAASHKFGSSPVIPAVDQPDKIIVDQNLSKNNNIIPSQEIDVDGLGYIDKKKSEKKKKKEKHKHREKDKDKSERKKEKKKHKEKDRERSKEKSKEKEKHKEKEIDVVSSEIPIKITIPKDKISGSLKFKISKDCLKKEETDSLKSNASGELKIKISKDVINSIGTYKDESKSDSKKRDRSPKSTSDLPYPKSVKTSEKKSSSSSLKPNGTEGSSRNSSSLRYSVSENGSCFDISGLYDFPFDFEESGQGIIKTPDYDFEALNASEFWQDINTSLETKEIEDCDKNSHNELELTKDEAEYVATTEPSAKATTPNPSDSCNAVVSCGDMATFSTSKQTISLTDSCSLKCSDFKGQKPSVKKSPSVCSPPPDNLSAERLLLKNKTEPFNYNTSSKLYSSSDSYSCTKDEGLPYSKSQDTKKDQTISLENCDILKNYKTILDSHSRRCESDLIKHRVSPISLEDTATNTLSNNDDNNNTSNLNDNESGASSHKISAKSSKSNFDTENPNYYNKYFKKNESSRGFTVEYKRTLKGRQDEKNKFDDRQKFYESRRFRNDFSERDRLREDRRNYREYRDYTKDSSQYYYDRKDDRRFDYTDHSSNQFFNAGKPETNPQNLNYEMNSAGSQEVFQKPAAIFPQMCDPPVPTNPDMNVQYQYGYYNNFVYPNNYRFYGNMPFVNMSLIQQQPIPPGTGDSVPFAEPPPLPLEPPPDLPPPPETPPPPPKL